MADADYYRALAAQDAIDAGFPPDVFVAQIQEESGFNPHALSPARAAGIAQFEPDTAASLGVDPWDPEASLRAAAQWMAQLLEQFGGRVDLALAAYNAGPGRVRQYGGIPPFEETQRYVRDILAAAGDTAGVAAGSRSARLAGLPDWAIPAGVALGALWLADVL